MAASDLPPNNVLLGSASNSLRRACGSKTRTLGITSILRPIIGLGISCVVLTAAAQPSADQVAAEVTDNIAMEYAECAAYFAIVQGAFQTSGNGAGAQKYKMASDKAAHFSLLAAQESRGQEMATKVTLARFQLSLKDMQRTIHNNYSNISLLSHKYSDSCVEAMTDSTAVMRRWTERITSKYGVSAK